jgi:hypothetical protein
VSIYQDVNINIYSGTIPTLFTSWIFIANRDSITCTLHESQKVPVYPVVRTPTDEDNDLCLYLYPTVPFEIILTVMLMYSS